MSHDLSGPLPEPGLNNLWFQYNDSDSVIVFLHGIFSDSRNCWLHTDERNPDRSVYWPALVRSDLRLGNPSIYLAGFYTAVDAGPYEIRNCAEEVLRALDRQDAEGRPGPMTKPTMVFVCHSTGGIVARYFFLEDSESRFVEKKLGLVLISSPSYGSKWADRLDLLAKLYNQQLGIQLQWGSWSLRDLDARFRNLVNQRRLPGLRGIEAYENHFVFHRPWLPNKKVIVTEESAGRYFGAPVLLRKTNHFTCVKPDSLRHPTHELLVDFWTKEMTKPLSDRPAVPSHSNGSPVQSEQDVRFDTAVLRMFNPLDEPIIGTLHDSYEPFPGIPFYSHPSDHPTAWPPRVNRDRHEFAKKIEAFVQREDVVTSLQRIEKEGAGSTQFFTSAGPSEQKHLALMALYSRLRMFRWNCQQKEDDNKLLRTLGQDVLAGLLELEQARDEIKSQMPNRLFILQVINHGARNASDFRAEIDVGGAIYDVTLNEEQGHARQPTWTPTHLTIEIPRLPPTYQAEVRVWYKYLDLKSRVFPGPGDFLWEETQGIRIKNISVSDGRVLRDQSFLKEIEAYERYDVDPSKPPKKL